MDSGDVIPFYYLYIVYLFSYTEKGKHGICIFLTTLFGWDIRYWLHEI